jgi:hypothetical protein
MLMPGDMDVWRRIDQAFWNRARWDLKFAWWPRRCALSNKWLWLELAYRGAAVWYGPGSNAVEVRWTDSQEYLIARLKGKV